MMQRLFVVLILCCALGSTGARAAESRLKVTLLSDSAGSPRRPDSIKVELRLPERWASTPFAAADVRFFIYPRGLEPKLGAAARYQAGGALHWRQGATLYADLRLLPQQEADGEFTLLAVVLRDGVVALSALADRPVVYRAEDVDVALVVDSSQSMARTDPKKRRVAAAQAFIDTAARDGRIRSVGLVRFNDVATVLCAPTALARKEVLLKSLGQINADGLTNIGRALESAQSMLSATQQGHRKAVVLLTDGKNESVAYADEHMAFVESRTPVYCVGLSQSADMSLLEKIAEQTGGRAFRATDHRDLMSIYQRIAAELGRRQLIFTRTVQDETVFPVPVDGAVRNISFAVDAGPQEAELTLTPPATMAGAEAEGPENAVTEFSRDGYLEQRISKPRPGIWLAHVRRKSGRDSLSLTVSGETSLFLDVFPLQNTEQGARIGATLAREGQPVGGSRVQVLPSGDLVQTLLFDDGLHDDGAANDGVYSSLLMPQSAGRARLLLSATGRAEGGDYIRQADAGESFLSWVPHASGDTTQKESAPLISSLSAQTLDLGELMPGQTVEKVLHVQYRGNPGRIALDCPQLVSEGGLRLDRPVLQLIGSDEVKAGEAALPVRFTASSEVRGGLYLGRAQAAVGGARCVLDVRVRVIPVTLQAAQTRIDLGYVRGQDALRFSVPLQLRSMVSLPVRVMSDAKQLAVSGKELQLQPGQMQVLPLVAQPAPDLAPGEHQVRIQISAGPAVQELQLRFVVPERGRSEHTVLIGHEVALLLPGHLQRYELQMHEMRIPHAEPATAAPFLPVAGLTEPIAVVASDYERWRDAALLLLAALLLAALLLLLRRLSKNRMTRFACLSVALHLPLVALVACYMLLSSQGRPDAPQAQTFTAALVVANGQDGSGPGVPEKSLLAGAPADEDNAARFREKTIAPEPDKLAVPVAHNAPEKVALTKRSLTEDMPQTVEPQVQAEAMRQVQPVVALPAARRSVPVMRRQPVPSVAALSAPAAQVAAQTEKENTAKIRTSAPAMAQERTQFAALPDEREAGLPAPAQRPVEVAPVAERDKPSMAQGAESAQRKPVRAMPVNSTQPDVQPNLPKVSELAAAGGEGAPARSIEQALAVADVSARELAPVPADLTGERSLLARGDRKTLERIEAAPNRESIASVPSAAHRAGSETARRNELANVRGIEPARPQMKISAADRRTGTEQAGAAAQAGATGSSGRIVTARMMTDSAAEAPAREFNPIRTEEFSVASLNSSDAVAVDDAPSVAAGESVVENTRTVRIRGAKPVRQGPASPEIAVPAQALVAQKTANGRGGAPLISERARFADGGAAIQAMAAPAGQGVRVERADISLGEGVSRPTGAVPNMPGIQRGYENAAPLTVGSANAGEIELTAGVVGDKPGKLFALAGERLPVQPVTAELTRESLGRCQVIVVTEMRTFSAAEMGALRAYLQEGGRVWFHGRKIPVELTDGGRVVRLGAGHPIHTACYDLGASLSFAEGFDAGGLCAVATGLDEPGKLPALAANTLAVLLGGLDSRSEADGSIITAVGTQAPVAVAAEGKLSTVKPAVRLRTWLDFSGIAPGKHGWSVEGWGENAALSLSDDGRGGEALLARIPAGAKGKTGLSYVVPDYEGRRMDLGHEKELRADIYYAGAAPASIALLLTTYDGTRGWDEYQTRDIALQPGWNRELSLPLRELRTRASGGAYSSPLYGADSCAKVTLFFRSATGNVLVDNLRWGE